MPSAHNLIHALALFFLVPAVLADGIGVIPPHLYFDSPQERQILLINENEHPIYFSVDGPGVAIDYDTSRIEPHSRTTVSVAPTSSMKKEALLPILFYQDVSGIRIEQSFSVRLHRIGRQSGKAGIIQMVDQLFSPNKRNFGPLLSFGIVVIGLVVYAGYRKPLVRLLR